MDGLILNHNFHTSNAQECEIFDKSFTAFCDKERSNIAAPDIRKAIHALHGKICTDSFGHYKSPPVRSALLCLQRLAAAIKNVGGFEQFHEELFNLYLGCLACGLTSGHAEVLAALGPLKFLEAIMINGENFTKLATALKKVSFVPGKVDLVDIPGYVLSLDHFARALMQNAMVDGNTLPRDADVWLEVYVNAYDKMIQYTRDQQPTASVCNIFISEIRHKYKREKSCSVYVLIQNKSVISDHITQIRQIVATVSQPSEELVSAVENWISDICEVLTKDLEVAKVHYASVLELVFVIGKLPEAGWLQVCYNMTNSMMTNVTKAILKEKTKADDLVSVMCTHVPDVITQLSSRDSKCVADMVCIVVRAFATDRQVTNPALATPLTNVVCALLASGRADLGELGRRVMEQFSKALSWKDNGAGADNVMKALRVACDKYEVMRVETDVVVNDVSRYVESAGEYLIELLAKLKCVKFINKTGMEIICSALERPMNRALHDLANDLTEHILWTEEPDLYSSFLDLSLQALQDDVILPIENVILRAVIMSGLPKSIEQFGDAGLGKRYSQQILKILTCCSSKPLEDDEGNKTYYETFVIFAITYFRKNASDVDVARIFAPVLLSLYNHEDSNVATYASSCMHFLSQNQTVLAEITPQLIELFLQTSTIQFIISITAGYPTNARSVHDRISSFIDYLQSSTADAGAMSMVMLLLDKVAAADVTVFTEQNAKALGGMLSHATLAPTASAILGKFVEKRPEFLNCQVDVLARAIDGQVQAIYLPMVITHWSQASLASEAVANQVLTLLMRFISSAPPTTQVVTLSGIRLIGVKYPALVQPHKPLIVQLKTNPQLQEMCNALIDVLEGRSLAGLSDEVTTQKAELKIVDDKVTKTEANVAKLDVTVKKQEVEINTVKQDIKDTNVKVSQVSDKVVELDIKVEEVDHKTMSNAPAWSRDVSRLLNPESPKGDWRMLATRLGYDNNEIRGWATQHDPTMALLSEWYTTHKTSDATHAVIKALEEMNRLDAVKIIREAKDTADGVVQDEVVDTGPLPQVFLSYQWGTQNEVRLLRQHLEMAGYRCWMDLGQMGGGDKLFAKIDAGMRAAKVVICCVTNLYAKSDNCSREVNLATTLGKPILPLLMTRDTIWPPEGAMGPIFSEYLYIQFFCNASDKPKTPNLYWPEPKFNELLMQLRFYVTPDTSIVKEEYADWWKPRDDAIVLPPSVLAAAAAQSVTPVTQQTGDIMTREEAGKDVFLSYQWGKQPEVQYLYKLLTAMGYSCWMDIYEMGGGDSLFDAIDKGIRHCKVIVSHVTTKYALSANCRREVSLSDALKKPIIPLLLDDMTWPPEGPMSMVFTQLLYIDFKDNNATSQQLWSGPRLDQLISKIDAYLGRKATGLSSVTNPVSDSKSSSSAKKDGGSGPGSPTKLPTPKTASPAQSSTTKPSAVKTTSPAKSVLVPKTADSASASKPAVTSSSTSTYTSASPSKPAVTLSSTAGNTNASPSKPAVTSSSTVSNTNASPLKSQAKPNNVVAEGKVNPTPTKAALNTITSPVKTTSSSIVASKPAAASNAKPQTNPELQIVPLANSDTASTDKIAVKTPAAGKPIEPKSSNNGTTSRQASATSSSSGQPRVSSRSCIIA